jgi:4'-phosphopantetheinyl transferase EntD
MLAEILPPAVVAVELFGHLQPRRGLFGAEESAIATADTRRQAEFAAGRRCAHAALAGLGAPAGPVLPGPAGEPCWPAGIVGSLTHCERYRACAVARAETMAAVGIDAEPARPLPAGLIETVAAAAERRWLAELWLARPELPWDLLLFCAKEAVYKAWFPLTGRRLGFADVLVEFAAGGGFTARVTGAAVRTTGHAVARVQGRWLVRDGLALTAATVRRRGRFRP